MMQDDVKDNLLSSRQWLRMLIMAGFLLAVWVLSVVLMVVMIVQTVTVLITGAANHNLRRFGAQSAAYLHQVTDYLVYASDFRPFPFAPFPDPELADVTIVETVVTPAAPTTFAEDLPPDTSWADDLTTDDPRDELDPDKGRV